MTTEEKILSMFPDKTVNAISSEIKTNRNYIVYVLKKYGVIDSVIREKGYRYGEGKFSNKRKAA